MDQKLLEKIADLYNLPKIKFQHKVAEGFLTDNYILIHNKTKYFLKQYRGDVDHGRVKEIHKVMNFFGERGVPVVLPMINMKNKKSKDFFTFEGMQYALFPFVKGLKIDRNDLSDTNLKNMAEMLAKIHLLSKKKYPHIKERQNRFDDRKFFSKLEEMLPFIEKDKKSVFGKMAYKDVVLKKRIIEENIKTIRSIKSPHDHLTQGDYHSDNVFFNKKGEVISIFDFDKTEVGSRVFELIRSMYYMCFEGVFSDRNFKRAKVYLSAYNALYPVSKAEIRNGIKMYFFNKAQSLWIEKHHYLNKSNRVDRFMKNELKTLIYLERNLEDFINKLTT